MATLTNITLDMSLCTTGVPLQSKGGISQFQHVLGRLIICVVTAFPNTPTLRSFSISHLNIEEGRKIY